MVKFDDIELRSPDLGDEFVPSRPGNIVRDYNGMIHTIKRFTSNRINLTFSLLRYDEYNALHSHILNTGTNVFVYTDYNGEVRNVRYDQNSYSWKHGRAGYSVSITLMEEQTVEGYYGS